MTDPTQETSVLTGDSGQPGQMTSKVTPQAISDADVKRIVTAVKTSLIEDRQSTKDRWIDEIKKTNKEGFEQQLTHFKELTAELGSERLAHLAMKMEDQTATASPDISEDRVSPDGKAKASQTTEAGKLTQQLTNALGLDANDAEVTSILRESDFATQAELMLTLADRRKKAQDAPANPAQQMPVGGGSAIQSPDKEAIAAEILRLNHESPSKNYARIQELNAKLK